MLTSRTYKVLYKSGQPGLSWCCLRWLQSGERHSGGLLSVWGRPSCDPHTSHTHYTRNQPHVALFRAHASTSPADHPNHVPEWQQSLEVPEAQLNWEYMCDPLNTAKIQQNIDNRKAGGDPRLVTKLHSQYTAEQDVEKKAELWDQFAAACLDIPNETHPSSPIGAESEATEVDIIGDKRVFGYRPKSVVMLGERLDILRTEYVSKTTGQRTYYFMNELVQLERALVKMAVNKLINNGFSLISVPDLINPAIIEACGFKTTGKRTQVYKLDPAQHGDVCLAATAEMPLAGCFMNTQVPVADLPTKVMAVSRCYRAETSESSQEQGIYRVHQFTKVEMFVLTADDTRHESDDMLEDIVRIQRELFTELGLYFRILDMPTEELGSPAYRKYDIETWMPGKQFWGEISSASNCTDYQSRRLNITYTGALGQAKHVHTVNGTACAIPRMIMNICTRNQNRDGSIDIPTVLQQYMNGAEKIVKRQDMLNLRHTKPRKII